MARSLNRVQLIGNLTRDPELRYTPSGAAVCSFGLATNRTWTTDTGEKHEDTEFHRIVSWNKLAEICSQFLVKGRKVYVEGRLSTRSWTGQDGNQRSVTEIVIDDMILLDSLRRGTEEQKVVSSDAADEVPQKQSASMQAKETKKIVRSEPKQEDTTQAPAAEEERVTPDDIPF